MKISIEEVSRLLTVSSYHRPPQAGSSLEPDPSIQSQQAAHVDISTSAQEIMQVKDYLDRLPDVREERVAALKEQVENGTYHVSGEDIADLIIRRALADNTAI